MYVAIGNAIRVIIIDWPISNTFVTCYIYATHVD